MGAMIRFQRQTGIDISQMNGNVEHMVLFMYLTTLAACRAEDIDFKLSFDEYADICTPEDMTAFYNEMKTENETDTKEEKKQSDYLNRGINGIGNGVHRDESYRL